MAFQQEEDIDQRDLLADLRNGSQSAFTELYEMYSFKMYVNILKMVKDEQMAEELVQELFVKIWQKREIIDVNVDFTSYLYRVGQNLVYDFFRKLQRDKKMYERFKDIVTEHYSHIEEALHLKQSEQALQQTLSKLSEQQSKVYKLCRIEGYTYKQAAAEMGISPHTVKEYLARANHLVKEYLLNNLDVSVGIFLFILFNEK